MRVIPETLPHASRPLCRNYGGHRFRGRAVRESGIAAMEKEAVVKSVLSALVFGLALAIPAAAQDSTSAPPPATTPPPAEATTPSSAAPASAHVMINPMELKWGDPPAVLGKGAKLAVLSGDPGAAGPYTIRLKLPAGYKISPHWHPTDENVTVIAGTFSLGQGEKFDRASMKTLTAGGYALLPAEMRHFAWTKGGATIQVHGMGPFVLNYVNPADDPSQSAGTK